MAALGHILKRRLNLWLLLVLFLCLGTCLVALNAVYMFQGMKRRMSAVCQSQLKSYRHGGAAELLSNQELLERAFGIHAYLLDGKGRDWATGIDQSSLLTDIGTGGIALLPPPRAIVVERNQAFTCIVAPSPGYSPPGIGLFPPPSFWFLPFLAAVCCTVAIYVTVCMRRMETAIARFGSKSLKVRMPPDVSEPFRRLARAFNQMADRIELLMDAQRRLCVDISHELRSPLTRLMLSARMARSGTPGALDRIELEAARLNDLVEELLDVARAEADPGYLAAEPVELRWLMTEIVDRCEIEAREKGASIYLDIAIPGNILGDVELLSRAIENVVRNAVRHTPVGSAIQVFAGTDGDHDAAIISVRDHGPGVPEADFDAIFRPFYRVEEDRDRRTGGVGLGLAIAERVVRLHHGSITAENTAPGLRVIIRLPRNPSAPVV